VPAAPVLGLRYSDRSMLAKFGTVDTHLAITSAVRIQACWRAHKYRNKTKLYKKHMKAKKDKMRKIQKDFNTPYMIRNNQAVLEWNSRWCRMMYQIVRTSPDILTLTEVDVLQQVQDDLAKLGYACGFSGHKYQPMHATKTIGTSFGEFLKQSGIAYAPNAKSNALAIGIDNTVAADTVHAAAEKMMGKHPCEKKWSLRLLFKEKKFASKGGTQALFKNMREIDSKVPAASAFDDDCSVVFWRTSRFSLSKIDYLDMSTKKKYKSAVKATLRDKLTGEQVQVITAHLASGLAEKDRKKRIKELKDSATVISSAASKKVGALTPGSTDASTGPGTTVQGIAAWFKESCQDGRCILSMDANSRPQFPGTETVWKVFSGAARSAAPPVGPSRSNSSRHKALAQWKHVDSADGEMYKPTPTAKDGGKHTGFKAASKTNATSTSRMDSAPNCKSVWDAYFDAEGNPLSISKDNMDPPVTVNKMRGSSSAQLQKIGLHAYELIDHVWYSEGVRFLQHALPPKHYRSKEKARLALIPDLLTPTDHFPLVVDLQMEGLPSASS